MHKSRGSRVISAVLFVAMLAVPFAVFDSVLTAPGAGAAVDNYTASAISSPKDFAPGSDGAMWFTSTNNHSIDRIDPTTHVVTQYTDPGISPFGIVAGPDSALWFTNTDGSIGRIDVSTHAITTYTDPTVSLPQYIAVGPDGGLWFTNFGNGSIGRIDPITQVITNYPGGGTSNPESITAGPDGAMWFTNWNGGSGSGSIGRINPITHAITAFTDPGINHPFGIAVASNNTLFFTNQGNDSIGKINTSGFFFPNYTDASVSVPSGIAVGGDGALYFTNQGNDSIGRIAVAGGVITNFTGSGISSPLGIAAGPDNAMWFTSYGNDTVGRISTREVDTFADPSIQNPYAVTTGPDGALWFTSDSNNAIDRIDPVTHAVSSYTDPSIDVPYGITSGPDGALWFTNPNVNTIGRIDPVTHLVTSYTDSSVVFPYDITTGPDGALWFLNYSSPGSIGRIDATTHVITNFADFAIGNPYSITTGPDGALWFTNSNPSSIGRITTAGVVTTYTNPSISVPIGISAGPDGALWFTNYGNDSIGRITTGGAITNFTDPSISVPFKMTTGADGALWFANSGNDSIGRIDPTTHAVTNFLAGAGSSPTGITMGPDGAVWFTNNGNGSVGRITTAAPFAVTTYGGALIDHPRGMTQGPDGAMWFTNASSNSIGRIDPSTQAVTNFSDPTVSGPDQITVGPDGALWFTNANNNSIGRITTAGVITNYNDPDINVPAGITAGPDGALWFANYGGASIERVTTSGVFTTFVDAGDMAFPTDIVTGPDGALWFTSYGSNQIGRLTTGGAFQYFDGGGAVNHPSGITLGSDGALWFTNANPAGGSIGRLNPTTHAITLFTAPSISVPVDITSGPDGALWFLNAGNDSVGRMDPTGLVVSQTNGSGISQPYGIASGPDGAVWFTNNGNSSIGRASQGYAAPVTAPVALSVVAGNDAHWQVLLDNPTGSTLAGVSVRLHAKANGTTPLSFNEGSMPGCSPGSGVELCFVSPIPAHSSVLFDVFVPTTGLAYGTDVTGDIKLGASGQPDSYGTLSAVNVNTLSIPSATPPGELSVVPGNDAHWTLTVNNPTANTINSVTATLHANANGSTPLAFNDAAMPDCAPGGGNSEVCSVGNLAPHSAANLEVFVPTTGLALNTNVTGDATATAVGYPDAVGTLAAVNINQVSVPPTVAPVSASITSGNDAVWSIPISNPTAATLNNVQATVHASLNNGAQTAGFHEGVMPGCAGGPGGAEVCNLASIPPHTTANFNVFVTASTGIAAGTTISGDFDITADGQPDSAGTMTNVTIAGCGANCQKGVVAPGAPLASDPGPPTPAKPTKQVVTLPTNNPNKPALAVTLQSINPTQPTLPSDAKLCPTAAGATHCSGQISSVIANFAAYNDPAHPIRVSIVARWGSTAPTGRILMEKATGGDPLFLIGCALNATTHKYNTPCVLAETRTGSTSAGNLITTNVVLFTALDVHFARRVATGGTVIKPPAAPTAVIATPGSASATLNWKAPTVTNGAGVTQYMVTVLAAGKVVRTITYNTANLTQVVTGLTNAKAYTFKVAAQNVAGAGVASAPSAATVSGAPGAPTAVTAVKAASGSIKVTFTAPATNGAPITGYTATCTSTNAGVVKTKAGTASPLTVTALTAGKTYKCTVKAANSRGTGPPSAASAAVIA